MENINLYWPIYKNLENELLKLSEEIHFDDYQLNVYSVKICDLLLRTVVEIEAISKELYFDNDGEATLDENGKDRPPYFDAECLAHLESLWILSKKQVLISATTFYFEKDENRILTPLRNAYKRGGCSWSKAYQAVKHNRTHDITSKKRGTTPKGNLKNLICAMATLYLLNIYYKNEKLENFTQNLAIPFTDVRLGSDIFSVRTYKPTTFSFLFNGNNALKDIANEATYIVKVTESSYEKIISKAIEGLEKKFS